MYDNQAREQARTATGYSSLGAANSIPPAPRDPGPTDRARELVGFLNELESAHSEIRVRLYGPMPQTGESLNKTGHEPCLDELLLMACQKASMAVSEARSILNRL